MVDTVFESNHSRFEKSTPDSVEVMDRLRHGAMARAFAGMRAPSTLGSFLRAFTHGHVQQLQAVFRMFLPALAAHTRLLPGAGQLAYVDIDDTVRRTYGYADVCERVDRQLRSIGDALA